MRVQIRIHTTAHSRRDLLFELNRLVDLNRWIYRTRSLPPLYQAGVRYRRETEDYMAAKPVEDWQAVDVLYKNGFGDCEDLAAARCAELRNADVPATIRLTRRGRIWHVTVRTPAGVEDPSRKLGMKGAA
ncbi:MAG: hypothetical protein OEZ01_00625 [Candidatus Heimdallarchaeota archaeon]|nr:hypothetical protein [Candidatus Heimdallarchaeota archaeon]MDH5676622.1 hypothetical protein [Myxococcales bacterium]